LDVNTYERHGVQRQLFLPADDNENSLFL